MSHRYNRLPLLCSQPGGVQQELVASLCRAQRYQEIAIKEMQKEKI